MGAVKNLVIQVQDQENELKTIKADLIEQILSQYTSSEEILEALKLDVHYLIEAEADRILNEKTVPQLIKILGDN